MKTELVAKNYVTILRCEETQRITTLNSSKKSITILSQGIGPRGPGGPAGQTFEYVQTIAAATWTVNHNLGFKPVVEVFSPGSLAVNCDVLHVSVNQTQILFNSPQTGFARFV